MTEPAPIDVTPASAIQTAIFELCEQRYKWIDRPDPNGVLAWIDQRIGALSQAQHDLEELATLKAALTIIKASVL